MTTLAKTNCIIPIALIMLSTVPVLAGAIRLAELGSDAQITAYNARFVAAPFPVALHIFCATLFCLLGAFQFDATIRLRYPRWHRMAGRAVASAGILTALTGAWLAQWSLIPSELQGELLYLVRLVVASAMALAITLAVGAVQQGHLTQHRGWMIRAYALGQGAGTQVIIMLPFTLLFHAPTYFTRDALMAAAWALNIIFAEWIIRRQSPLAKFH